MRLLVCLLPVLPYTFNVHFRWLYAPIKGLKVKGRFIFLFFFAMRQPDATACDEFATQTFAKPISQCAFVGLRTPLNM